MIYYLPIERMDMRYTNYMHDQIITYLNHQEMEHIIVEPIENAVKHQFNKDSFFHPGFTGSYKARQIAFLTELYRDGTVKDGDTIFCSDMWLPGIEMVAYLNHLYGFKNIKLNGILHAGSYTPTDTLNSAHRWASYFEEMLFEIFDNIYVASEFHKDLVIRKRNIDPKKISVTPFLLDYANLNLYEAKKQNIVIFNGRHHPEKQPELFKELERRLGGNDWKFIDTHELQLSKNEYYALLAKSKVVVSFAKQEHFGFGIHEAVYLGCIPVLPNDQCYPEFYNIDYLYDSWEECVGRVDDAMMGSLPVPDDQIDNGDTLKTWLG